MVKYTLIGNQARGHQRMILALGFTQTFYIKYPFMISNAVHQLSFPKKRKCGKINMQNQFKPAKYQKGN